MIAADTSVVVAAFAPWHADHAVAHAALDGRTWLPVHCLVEAYSALTRLPAPFRVPSDVAAAYLDRCFADRLLLPDARSLRALPGALAVLGVTGGAAYDALVALTARDHGATLVSLDRRAERTYRLLGVDHRLIG